MAGERRREGRFWLNLTAWWFLGAGGVGALSGLFALTESTLVRTLWVAGLFLVVATVLAVTGVFLLQRKKGGRTAGRVISACMLFVALMAIVAGIVNGAMWRRDSQATFAAYMLAMGTLFIVVFAPPLVALRLPVVAEEFDTDLEAALRRHLRDASMNEAADIDAIAARALSQAGPPPAPPAQNAAADQPPA